MARAQARGGRVQRTSLACSLHALHPVGAYRAGLALTLDGELLAGAALVPALLARHGLGRAGGLAQTADLARKAALLRLVETVTARSAAALITVVVLARTAPFLTVVFATGSGPDGDRRSASDRWTRLALQLA